MALALVALSSPSLAFPFGRIVQMQPIVMVRGGGAPIPVPAREKTEIHPGDTVEVGSVGSARVVFRSGTIIGLGPRGVIRSSLSGTPDRSLIIEFLSKLSQIFVIQQGSAQVRTGAATAASPGTQYLVETLADDSTVLTVLEGTVRFYNPTGTVTVQSGQRSMAHPGQAPSPPVAVDVSGLVEWSANTMPPAEYETPFAAERPSTVRLRELEEAVRKAPQDPTVHQRLGEALYDTGLYSRAAEQFAEGVRLAPENASCHYGLAQSLRGQGQLDQAGAEYKRALALSPGDVHALTGLALLHVTRHEYPLARATVEPVRETAAGGALLGLIALREGDARAAVPLLEQAAARDPRLYQAQALLALARLVENEVPGALAAARVAANLAPSSAQAHGTLAMVLLFAGRRDEAVREAGRAARLDPLSPFALDIQGRTLLSQQRPGEALNALRQARTLAPDLVPVHVDLGSAYLALGRPRDAEASYRRAVELAPRFADAHAGLGMAQQRQGRTAQAVESYRHALVIQPSCGAARQNWALLLTEQGDLESADRMLRRAAADRPGGGMVYVRQSEVALLQRQDLHAAEMYARRALEILPDSGIAHYQLGRVYLEQGRLVQAEHEFRYAVVLDPELADARYALGYVRAQDLRRPSVGPLAVDIASLSRLITLMNLEAPGLNDRVQAATMDPTVIRIATRAYGDSEFDGAPGNLGTRDVRFSHLHETPAEEALAGFTASHYETEGIRPNADTQDHRGGLVLGRRSAGSRLGTFILGEVASRTQGLNGIDIGGFPAIDLADYGNGWEEVPGLGVTARSRTNTPRLLAGLTYAPDDRFRTRLLLQFSQPRQSLVGLQDDSGVRQDTDNQGLELRTDARIGYRSRILAGLAVGSSVLKQRQRAMPADTPLVEMDDHARIFQAYVRHETSLNPRLSLSEELQFQRARTVVDFTMWDKEPATGPGMSAGQIYTAKQLGLGKLLVTLRPDARSQVRVRIRRVFGSMPVFQLLAPTDEFDDRRRGLPDPAFLGIGWDSNLEYSRTFRNASFLRIGVGYQDLNDALDILGGYYMKARTISANVAYEGSITERVTFFVDASFNHAQAKYAEWSGFIEFAPRWAGEAGLSFQDRNGWFVAPSIELAGGFPPSTASHVVGGEMVSTSEPIPGYGLLNLRLGRRWGLRFVAFVDVLNVLDKRYTLFRPDLEQPRRTYRAGLVLRF